MEWLSSGWDLAIRCLTWIGPMAVAYFLISACASAPFLVVQIWKLNRRLDRLGLLDVWAEHQEKKPKEKREPPEDFKTTMARHERAAKRMSEGLDLNEG